MATNVALVIGATGIVGSSLIKSMQAGGRWRIFGVARRGKPALWEEQDGTEYVECDLQDKEQALQQLSCVSSSVTHIFWAAWAPASNEEEECAVNGAMLDNLLAAVLPQARRLKHICLTTGAKHYVGPHFRFGSFQQQRQHLPYSEDVPRLCEHPNFYYVLEDKVLGACSSRPSVSWSVHRPNIILGSAHRSFANVLGSLLVYAAICKKLQLRFRFPGSKRAWTEEINVSDARLIAEQQLWAAAAASARNECFNAVNFDRVTWEQLWEVMCSELQLQGGLEESFSVEEFMRDKGEVWEGLRRDNSLVSGGLEPGMWWVVDLCLNLPFQLLSSVEKCRRTGFESCSRMPRETTAACVRYWIADMKANKLVP